jgi:hypothetical protein
VRASVMGPNVRSSFKRCWQPGNGIYHHANLKLEPPQSLRHQQPFLFSKYCADQYMLLATFGRGA